MKYRLLTYTAFLLACGQAVAQSGQFRNTHTREVIGRELASEPYATDREALEAAVADTYFFEGDYSRAAQHYATVSPDALTGDVLAGYRYRYGYSLMQLGEYAQADAEFAAMPEYASAEMSNAALFYRGYIAFTRGDYRQAEVLFGLVDDTMQPGTARDYYLAQIAYSDGNADKALELSRKAAKLGLPGELALENDRIAGESLYMLGDRQASVPYLRRYVRGAADPAMSARYILGLSYYEDGEYRKAVEVLTPVAQGADAMAQSASLYIGQSQIKSGDVDGAILAFSRAAGMDADPDVRESACYNYAVARTRGGQVPFGSSVTAFEDFLRQYPSSVYASDVREYIVNGYMTDRNYYAALRSIEKVTRPSERILAAKQRVLYALAARDLGAGHPVTALEYVGKARKYSKYDADINAETYMLSGDANYRLERYDDAIADYRRYLALARKDAANIPLARYNLGYAYFAGKNFAQSAGQFAAAVSEASLPATVRADAANRIGDTRYYAGDFGGALSHYRQAYDLNPATGDYALFQTAAMQGYERDFAGKLSTLSRLNEGFPNSSLLPQAYLEMAETYLQLSRPDDALETYRQLVRKYPNTTAGRNGYLQMAQTLENTGKQTAATGAYQDIVRRYPTSDEARLATVALKRTFAEGDRIDELVAFLNSVPGAPALDPSEVEKLAFDAAEDAYSNSGDASRLENYLRTYPGGAYVPQALAYLVNEAFDNADDANALDYANRILEDYPDSPAVEDALMVKAELMLNSGDNGEALECYRSLLTRASTPVRTAAARRGIMRVARELGLWNDVAAQADALLASSVLGDGGKTEAVYCRGEAYERLGRDADAERDYKSIASQTDDIYGARSGVALGQMYLDAGKLKNAAQVAEKFVASSTPHSYWLARGFILLSDINRAQGKTFEADEYLSALRQNYPGDEEDIFMMIDSRLNK